MNRSKSGNNGKISPALAADLGAGIAVMAVGVVLMVVPGVAGIPLVVVGALLLSPWIPAMARFNRWIEKKHPLARGVALDFYARLQSDMAKRYPK
ncbi:MAG: hypothetical protein NTV79_02440 [Candidatus Aureabacteria bacterium]|nr:hypothetical protein [Candidatus Auribacterota bacterium]